MDRYKVEISELQPKGARSWLRNKLQKNEKMSLVSHEETLMPGGKIRTTLIFEDPLLGLMSHLETQDSLLGDEEE